MFKKFTQFLKAIRIEKIEELVVIVDQINALKQ